MRGIRPDIVNPLSSAFSATGLTGLDTTTRAFAYAAWMRWDNVQDCDWFWQTGNAGLTEGIGIGTHLAGSTLRLFTMGAAGFDDVETPASTPILLRGQWAHYGIAWDGTTARFYRNGALFAAVSFAGRTPTNGGTRTTTQLYNTGLPGGPLFDLRVFPNVCPSDAEMRACVDPRHTVAGAKGRWFRHGFAVSASGSERILDESGNGNDLFTSSNPVRSQLIEPPPFVSVLASTQRRTRVLRGIRTATATAAFVPTDLAHARAWQPLVAQ